MGSRDLGAVGPGVFRVEDRVILSLRLGPVGELVSACAPCPSCKGEQLQAKRMKLADQSKADPGITTAYAVAVMCSGGECDYSALDDRPWILAD